MKITNQDNEKTLWKTKAWINMNLGGAKLASLVGDIGKLTIENGRVKPDSVTNIVEEHLAR